jgi:hypothetical protein
MPRWWFTDQLLGLAIMENSWRQFDLGLIRAVPEQSHDTQAKRNNPKLLDHSAGVYRVLLSRAS